MRNYARRLKHIEQSFDFDASGYAPGSDEWQKYWNIEIEKHAAGEPHQRLPFEAIRTYVQTHD